MGILSYKNNYSFGSTRNSNRQIDRQIDRQIQFCISMQLVLNQDLRNFEDYRGRLWFGFKGDSQRITFYTVFQQRRDASRLLPDRFQYKFTRQHLVLNQDLQDFEDYRGRLWFKRKGHLQMITFYHPFRRCVTHRRKGRK